MSLDTRLGSFYNERRRKVGGVIGALTLAGSLLLNPLAYGQENVEDASTEEERSQLVPAARPRIVPMQRGDAISQEQDVIVPGDEPDVSTFNPDVSFEYNGPSLDQGELGWTFANYFTEGAKWGLTIGDTYLTPEERATLRETLGEGYVNRPATVIDSLTRMVNISSAHALRDDDGSNILPAEYTRTEVNQLLDIVKIMNPDVDVDVVHVGDKLTIFDTDSEYWNNLTDDQKSLAEKYDRTFANHADKVVVANNMQDPDGSYAQWQRESRVAREISALNLQDKNDELASLADQYRNLEIGSEEERIALENEITRLGIEAAQEKHRLETLAEAERENYEHVKARMDEAVDYLTTLAENDAQIAAIVGTDGSVARLGDTFRDVIQNIESEKDSIEAQLVEATDELTATENNLNELRSEYSVLDTNYNDLLGRFRDLNEKNKGLVSQLGEKTGELESLTAQYNLSEKEKGQALADLASTQSELDALGEQYSSLEADVKDFKRMLADKDRTIGDANETIDGLNLRILKYEAEVSELNDGVDLLKKQLGTVEAEAAVWERQYRNEKNRNIREIGAQISGGYIANSKGGHGFRVAFDFHNPDEDATSTWGVGFNGLYEDSKNVIEPLERHTLNGVTSETGKTEITDEAVLGIEARRTWYVNDDRSLAVTGGVGPYFGARSRAVKTVSRFVDGVTDLDPNGVQKGAPEFNLGLGGSATLSKRLSEDGSMPHAYLTGGAYRVGGRTRTQIGFGVGRRF